MVTAGKTNWAAPGSLARTDANTGRPHGVAAALHPAGVGPAGETSRAEGFAPRSLAHTGTDVALPAGVAAAALGAGGALLLVNRRRRTAKTTKS
jgi:LPXTG-motif cell wall-anchored protein